MAGSDRNMRQVVAKRRRREAADCKVEAERKAGRVELDLREWLLLKLDLLSHSSSPSLRR